MVMANKLNITNVQELYDYAIEQGLKNQAQKILRDNLIKVDKNGKCQEVSANTSSSRAYTALRRLVDGLGESLNKSNKLTLNEDLFEESYWNPETMEDVFSLFRGNTYANAFRLYNEHRDGNQEIDQIIANTAKILILKELKKALLIPDGEVWDAVKEASSNTSFKESLNKGIREDVEPEGDDIVFTPDDSLIDNGEVVNAEKPDEQTPETPEENGVARLILHAINGETDTIAEYNDLIANTDNEDIIRIIQDITAEENNHIGMLQKALELISPNASNIDDGMKEAEGMIEETGEVVEESLTEEKEVFTIMKVGDGVYSLGKGNPPVANARKRIEANSPEEAKEILMRSGYSEDELVFESLTEADTLHQKFKKDIKNQYKSWASRQEKTEQKRKDMMDILNDHEDVSDETRDMWTQKVNDLYPNQEFDYDFPRNLEKIDYPFYVTYYAEYPIYEPAEGGYYYAGNDAIWSEGFNTEEEAWEYADKYIEQDDEWGEWQKFTNGYKLDGKYIGQNQYVVVEPKKAYLGMVKGWEPYQ